MVWIDVGFKRKSKLKSWDKFTVPKLFTKATVIYSNPIRIDKDLSYNETSKMIEKCEKILNQIQNEAEIF